MADVSIDALQKVKSTLTIFQSDISGIAVRATVQAQNCLDACQQKISETQSKLGEIEAEIVKLNRISADLENRIKTMLNEAQRLRDDIPRMEKRLQGIRINICDLQDQLAALQAQLTKAEDDEEWQQIQSQIDIVTARLNSIYREQSELEYQIQAAEKQEVAIRQKADELKSERFRCEEKLSMAKKRKFQYQQKFDKLKTLLDSVKSHLDDYVSATRKFESSSSISVGQDVQIIDKCIVYIEQYLFTIL